VQTEVDGKPSGWAAFYENDKWVVREKAAKASKTTAAKTAAKKAPAKKTKVSK